MTWHAAARAADATAFARGVIASKLVFSVASGPEDPVCKPLLSFVCSCDFLLWSCKLNSREVMGSNSQRAETDCFRGSGSLQAVAEMPALRSNAVCLRIGCACVVH